MEISITNLTAENDAKISSRNRSRAMWRFNNPAATRYHDMPMQFVAIDGEGVTLPDGSHRYVLLGVGDQQVTNPDGLTFEQCMDFLWEQFLEHGTRVSYVGFFLTYDFTQWLRSLTENRASMLLSAAGKAARAPRSDKRVQPFPVRYHLYEFDMLGSKRFKLRKHSEECMIIIDNRVSKCTCGSKRWMYICDAGPFFQKSFLSVIDPAEWSDPVVTKEEYETIRKGKNRRSTAILDSDMLYYNARENEILPRVLCALDSGFRELGIYLRPNQWFGPGQAAQKWLDRRAPTAKRIQEVVPAAVLEAARMSYLGGWFEIMMHGIIPGITHEYDINSAYPYIISCLPCLEHGKWEHGKYDETGYTLVYAEVIGSNPYIGTMLHRDDKGNIYRPHHTEGWYWLHEIVAAKRAKIINTCRVRDSWVYVPCDCLPPMREVQEIYNLRKQVGKKTPLGIACKLVPNSLYGKFAQSIGSPKYANPVYASLITAGCRTMILNAIATHPDGPAGVTMVATDGVYFRSPHPGLPVSEELGNWDHNEKSNLCQFKPGVYWADKDRADVLARKKPKFKARGVSAKAIASRLHYIDGLFEDMYMLEEDEWPGFTYPVDFAMITALQALQRNDWALAGTLLDDAKARQSSNPKTKRCDRYQDGDVWRTRPRVNDPYEPSHAYQKRFGMDDPYSDVSMEKYGVTPDGYVVQLFREAIGL